MYYYRVSKYNPKLRDSFGNYLADDWTSYSDIGKMYLGKKLTFEEYKKVELSYIKFVLFSMKKTNIKHLKIEKLEKYADREGISTLSLESEMLYNRIKINYLVGVNELSRVLELQLRDFIWTKLTSDNLTIDFGYDYYMYVTSKQMIPYFHNSKFGKNIYIEENIKSPYTDI